MSQETTVLDRVYAVLHQLESEQERRQAEHEASDWFDGVETGCQAEKRLLIERLHWILDPTSIAVDMTLAGPLVTRLNERHTEGFDKPSTRRKPGQFKKLPPWDSDGEGGPDIDRSTGDYKDRFPKK